LSSTLPTGPPIVTRKWKLRDYATFSISVTEYCRDEKLTARGIFRTEGGIGEEFEFEDGNTTTAVNVGYNDLLRAGVYDIQRHILQFEFGECKWNQYFHSADYRGYCIPGKWTQEEELKCDEDADSGRASCLPCVFIFPNMSHTN
jgi:hypothetical protein